MTKVLYHLMVLPPEFPEREAYSQEISALRDRFGGDLVYLNPNQQSPIYLPRIVFGLHRLRQLRTLESDFDLHHLYNPDPFPFPVLRGLRQPVVYSVTGGLGRKRPNVPFFASMAAVTVYDQQSLKRLQSWGLTNAFLVHPGIDSTRITPYPIPLRSEIRLLVGSAPWTPAQFRTKGIDALLTAAQRDRRLRLTFLWRGVLEGEMLRRVRRRGLTGHVKVLNKQVDVNEILAGVHASISLASAPDIVKAYPHSLLESLAAGKPVLVSRSIPMADYVQRTECGIVVEGVTPEEILAAVEFLFERYSSMQSVAQTIGKRDFQHENMIGSFQRVYQRIIASSDRNR
jgi:glycosyltransferase involved in cell wall biosynthesis